MLSGDFASKLRKLNPRLNIWAGRDDTKPAGIWYLTKTGEYQEICGVDKNWVSEFTEWTATGGIRRGGWLRVIKILVNSKLVDRFDSYKLFGNWEFHKQPPFVAGMSQIDRDVAELYKQVENKGKMNSSDVADVGREIANGKK